MDRQFDNGKLVDQVADTLPAPPPEITAESLRAAVVAAAEAQLGVTDPSRYWLDVHGSIPTPAPGKRVHWCGALALWALRRAGLVDWSWSFDQRRPGFIWRIGWGQATRKPEPGDVCYCDRAQHHAIVERVEGRVVYTIDGNTGNPPGIVARSKGRQLARADVHYYSIRKLVAARLTDLEAIKGATK